MHQEQLDKVRAGKGFIAALDQSGGSTPKALKLYGVDEDAYDGEVEMFDRIHEMRTRIITSPSFTGERVLGAILFEQTMDRQIEGRDTAEYLWEVKGVVPFLKIDKGLADEADDVQLMKPMPGLDELLARAAAKRVFGTKERSVIKLADEKGVNDVVDQQFEVGRQVLGHGLVPIIEPEVDIKSPQKAEAEALLKAALVAGLYTIPDGQQVMFKLTLPDSSNAGTLSFLHKAMMAARSARHLAAITIFSSASKRSLTSSSSTMSLSLPTRTSIFSGWLGVGVVLVMPLVS